MRVTHIITRLIVGGAQENTIASVLGLRKTYGLSVDLIAGPTSGPEGSLESLVASQSGFHRVPSLVRPVHPYRDFRALVELTALLKRLQPDLVHTHSGKAGILGRFAAARAGVPLVIHGIHGPSFGPFQGPTANWIFQNLERMAGRRTHHFVTVSHAMSEQYLAAGIGTPGQYTRIFSGFQLQPYLSVERRAALQAQLGIGPDDVVIGKIARLFKLKGHDDLFAAAPGLLEKHPHLKFLLVGGGVWRGRFEALAERLRIRDRFVFAGLIPPAEVPEYLGLMDILVHLSRREGLARALPQALAAGKPVVSYDCDGAGEVCLPGETGFLVQPGDIDGLKATLDRLIRSDSLRESLGAAGRNFVIKRFSEEKMVDDLHALYRKLRPKERNR